MLDSFLSHDIKIILNSYFWRKTLGLWICVRLEASCHIVSRKSLNHWCFIDLNAWRYFTPRGDVI